MSIDSFDGRGIHYGGIKFSGTARDVYWDALVRGVRKEINDQFAWIDQEVRNYNRETALRAIDECAGQLISFAKAIRREAIAKDRILRGDGISFPKENDAGHWEDTSDADIAAQAEALKTALPHPNIQPQSAIPDTQKTVLQRASAYWHENQGWIGPIMLVLAIAGLLPLVL